MEALALFKDNVDSLFDLCFLPQPTACLSLFRSCLSLSCTNQVDYVAAICCSSFFFFSFLLDLFFFSSKQPLLISQKQKPKSNNKHSLSHYCSPKDQRIEGYTSPLWPTAANAWQRLPNFDAIALSSSTASSLSARIKWSPVKNVQETFLLYIIPRPYSSRELFPEEFNTTDAASYNVYSFQLTVVSWANTALQIGRLGPIPWGAERPPRRSVRLAPPPWPRSGGRPLSSY